MEYPKVPPRLNGANYELPRTYFVTFCVFERAPIFADARLAQIACKWIKHFSQGRWYWLYAFAVMPDHIHLVLRLSERGAHLSRVVAMIRSAIRCECRRLYRDFRWQRGYHDRIIRKSDDCQAMVAYVLANPSRLRLVHPDEQYPFSGIIDSWR